MKVKKDDIEVRKISRPKAGDNLERAVKNVQLILKVRYKFPTDNVECVSHLISNFVSIRLFYRVFIAC